VVWKSVSSLTLRKENIVGAKLVQYYELVGKKDGLVSRMRMAMKTGIPSNDAASAPDSPENLSKFYEAAKEILGAGVPQL